jgi:hypothetical protein
MPVPPPAPPTPGLSPPVGESASPPLLLAGSPTFDPGSLEMTAPAFDPLPPFVVGAAGAPTLRGAPMPVPRCPLPELDEGELPPTDGGGGTTFVARSVPLGAPLPPAFGPVPPPALVTEGGGGTTLGAPSVGAVEE